MNRPKSRLSRIGILLGLIVLTSGCNTLMEASNPRDTTSGYRETKNAEGETIYVRERPVSSWMPEPLPTPSATPTPIAPTSSYEKSAPTTPPIANSLSATSPVRVGLEAALTDGHAHLGVHGGLNNSPYFEPRIGLSIFASKDLYAGVDASLRVRLPIGELKPFAGLGGYLGDTKECGMGWSAETGRYEEICVKKFLSAGYAEAGIELGHFSIFMRDYRLTRAGLHVPTKTFVGFGIRF
ncbi:MAG TPA: hypothetical protein PLZ57_15580 [Pseudobdellovibrionaceae bacterium]|nr:hypothetical protein [Pseudobdellovibrionaceae bacterium]